MENKKVVTRFAPSPTGFMHVGGVRTAIFAYLWAKKNNGSFILRIEDTDKEREVKGSIEHIMESLKWFGVNWDEGPKVNGPHAPYIQSERLDLYKKYAEKLIEKGLAYADPYTEEELENLRKKAEEEKKPFLYRNHRPDKFEAWDGSKPLRFKVTNIKRYEWNDIVFGDLSAGEEALDDFILIKSDGYPTYNFAHVVDDIEMDVTHVMRGQEFISSTPKFLSLYEALEVQPPIFATLPPILGEGGNKKLSKRDGAKDILEYRKEGYLPEAMFNFLTFLGWNPGGEKEIYTKDELINVFDINKIQKSGAQWNDDKLDWMNKEHIRMLSQEDLKNEIFRWLPEELHKDKLIPLTTERISKFGDIQTMLDNHELDYFYKKPEYDSEGLIYKDSTKEKIANNLSLIIKEIESIKENFDKDKIKEVIMTLSEKVGNRGEVLHPMRFALSGLPKSPDPFTISEILGKDETISRLNTAINKLI